MLAAEPTASRLLLVVDQLEELFTYKSARRELSMADGADRKSREAASLRNDRDEVEAFCETVHALTTNPECWVVVMVRVDFYLALMLSPLWSVVRAHRTEALPLSPNGLWQAIVQPAAMVGCLWL
jgi:hypothetical protein